MKNKKRILRPMSIVKSIINEVDTADKEQKRMREEFEEQWNKWGRPVWKNHKSRKV